MSAPTLIPVATFDTIETNIIALLQAFSTEQSGLGASPFAVVQQFHIVDPTTILPGGLVNVYCKSVDPDEERSGAHGPIYERATFYLDCYARGGENPGVKAGDAAAHAVLKYLGHVVRWCIERLANYDFGFSIGTIARKTHPRFELMAMETTENEPQVVAGRVTLEVEYGWNAEDLSSTNLTEINVLIAGILPGFTDTADQVDLDYTGLA
jgi:hypothetical protein